MALFLNNTIGHTDFWEFRGPNLFMEIRFNRKTQSLRTKTEDVHELYFIDQGGLMRPKILFKNEYDLFSGELYFTDSQRRAGTLLLKNKRYYFQLVGGNIQLFNNQKKCLPIQFPFSVVENTPINEFAALLFAVVSLQLQQSILGEVVV